jgi:hypothetical protein
MIFLANDILQIARTKLTTAATDGTVSSNTHKKLEKKYLTEEAIIKFVRSIAIPARDYLEDQLLKHWVTWQVVQHTSVFCPWNAGSQAMKDCIQFFKVRGWIDETSATQATKEIERYLELASESGMELNHIS